MSSKFWPGTLYLKSVYKSLPADQQLWRQSDELRPCPDCGLMFTAYWWRRHRGVSTDERCPNTGTEVRGG